MSIITSAMNLEGVLLASIRQFIEQEARRLLDKHVEELEAELTKTVSRQIGKTVLELSEMVSFERSGTHLKITVEDRRGKEEKK